MADMQKTGAMAPDNLKYDEKALKRMVGVEVDKVSGISKMGKGFGDTFKSEEDETRGISVSKPKDNKVSVNVKIVPDMGANIPEIVNGITYNVADVLKNSAGLNSEIKVEVVDVDSPAQEHKREHNLGARVEGMAEKVRDEMKHLGQEIKQGYHDESQAKKES